MAQNWISIIESNWIFSKFYQLIYIYIYIYCAYKSNFQKFYFDHSYFLSFFELFCISGVLKLFNIYIKHVRMFFTSQMQKLFFLVFSQECNHLLGNKQFFTENVYFEKTYYMPKQNWKSNKPKFFMSKLKLTKMPSSSCQKKKKKKMPSSFLPLKIYQVVVKVL